jgi:LPS-assembly protein
MSWYSAPPPFRRRALALAALVTVAAVPLHARAQVVVPVTPQPGQPGQPAAAAKPVARVADEDAPVVLRAEDITGRPDRDVQLDRNVEVTRGQTGLTADTACYLRVPDEVTAKGNVNMWRFGDRYQGDEMQMNMETGKGWILHPTYRIQASNAQGRADRIDFIDDDEAMIYNGTYSTCEGPDPDWYLKTSRLRLDSGRDVGKAGKTVIYFKDVPILGTPSMSFSLSGERRSGWLPPTIGFGSKGSAEVMVPYYFNIAPNRDLTLFPRLMLDRGIQMGFTGRYLGVTDAGNAYSGSTHAEGLLHDRAYEGEIDPANPTGPRIKGNGNRWLVTSLHNQQLAPGWAAGWNIKAASDDEYPSDFSRTVAASAERQLLREISTSYNAKYWSLSARMQNYQVLQDPGAYTNPVLTVARPYDRLPQIVFHAGQFDVAGGFDWSFDSEATRFSHPTQVEGNRVALLGQVSYPIVRPGYFITPKVQFRAAQYSLDLNGNNALTAANVKSPSVTAPTVSLDGGLVFERDTGLFGKNSTQTLEPRLFYVRTPYRNQDDIPLFDSAEAGFSYSQLFNENRYVGYDRIADANQVTAAVVSRFLSESGAERLRLAIGQRFYLSPSRVGRVVTADTAKTSKSDVLLAAGGSITDALAFDSAVEYDAQNRSLYSSNVGVSWRAGPMKVMNLAYRQQRNTDRIGESFRNVDVSGQWPLSARLYGLARVSYSLLGEKKPLESLVGLEYKADCWVFRAGASRFVTASQSTQTTSFFQLELNGLSRLGFGNPLDSFSKSVPGYSRLSQTNSL